MRLFLIFALAALVCRAVVPAGFMAGPGGTITICTGNGLQQVELDRNGTPIQAPTEAVNDCAFAALAAPALPPAAGTALVLPAHPHAAPLSRAPTLAPGRGLAAPPPPPTGPPATV